MDFVCPHCSTACEGRPEVVGTEVRCPSCRKTFIAQVPRKDSRFQWGVISVCCALVVLTAGVVFWMFSDTAPKTTTDGLSARQQSIERVEPEPLLAPEIHEKSEVNSPAPRELLKRCVTITTVDSNASGFFFKRKGRVFVVTCNHVVFDQPFLIIHDLDGKEYPATKVYCAKDRDMALVALKDATNLHVPSFEIAEDVGSIAIESDLVCYGDSEGKGVIVRSEGKLLGIGPRVIETDTTIVPGNSGGPIILSSNGKVVGIASHLTINSGTWVKGTRFDNQTRRFAVRMDNADWEEIMENGVSVLQPTEYHEIFQFAQDVSNGGNGHDPDPAHAFDCSLWAASHGDAEAQTEIGVDYEFGIGIKQDIVTAIKWYQKAAEQKEPKAQRILGIKKYRGDSIPRDKDAALDFLQSAAEAGDVIAMKFLGFAYSAEIQPDWKKSFFWFQRASETGDTEALGRIGRYLELGLGVTANVNEAIRYYKEAAAHNDSFSQYRLGRLYYLGLQSSNSSAISKDKETAVTYFHRAIENNNFTSDSDRADCLYWLGLAYYTGTGTNLYYPSAVEYFEKAARLGHSEAQSYLGTCYEYGRGVPINEELAFTWYLEAAKGGDAVAQHNVGYAYDLGKIRPRNRTEAASWYRRSAEQGLAVSQLNLGVLYMNGDGVMKNAVEAVKWWRKAAEQGDLTAMSNLGISYYYGTGVPKDEKQARFWIQKAADKGNSAATEFLQKHPDILHPSGTWNWP